jgi:hypothetical protein
MSQDTQTMSGAVGVEGQLTMRVIRGRPTGKNTLWWRVHNWLTVRWRELGLSAFLTALPLVKWVVPGLTVMHGALHLKVIRGDGTEEDYGVVGRHLITTAGKNYVASTFDNTAEPEILKYHGYGTGTTAAAIGNTALVTELTTEYASDNTRPTGSQTHSTNTYTTQITLTPDSGGTLAITEWGLFSQAANSGGTLLDRQVFSAINLNSANGDSLQTTYTLTIS